LAADGLAQFGQSVVKALIHALEEGETAARAGAARALSTIQPEEAIPALYRALDDPSALVTYYADGALEKMDWGIMLFRP
jgi:HEAT repeat protein